MEQGPWGLSPLRPDPSSLPRAGVLLSSPLPLLLPTSPRPLPPSPGPAPTKVDEVAGAAAESCARSSCRDAGPVGEQGSHQVHVLVHDGYVQCSLTWPRESSQSWGLSPESCRGPSHSYTLSSSPGQPKVEWGEEPLAGRVSREASCCFFSYSRPLAFQGAGALMVCSEDDEKKGRWREAQKLGVSNSFFGFPRLSTTETDLKYHPFPPSWAP